jgi:spermidine/putrescine-binding protein
MEMIKRTLSLALASVLTVSLLAGCSKANPTPSPDAEKTTVELTADGYEKAKLAKELNLFNWSEYIPQSVLDDFAKEYGVKVNYDAYGSNEEMMAKLQAGGTQYDIVVPSTFMVEAMAKAGLLQELDQKLIPNLKNVESRFLNLKHDPGNKLSVPYMWGTVGIAYNKTKVEKAPESWQDLLNPKYKGKIVVVDAAREAMGIGMQAAGKSWNDTNPDAMKAGGEWLKKLAPSVLAWDSDNPKGALISGDAWLGVVWNGEAALAMGENKEIEYVIPKEGGMLWLDSMVIPKSAKNAYTAHVFINYILRPEVAAKIGEEFPYGLPNTEGLKLLPDEIKQNKASYPPAEWLKKAEYASDIGKASSEVDRLFTEAKAAK